MLQIDKEFLVGVGEVRGCLVVDRNLGHDVAGQGLCQIRSSGVTKYGGFDTIVLLSTTYVDVLLRASLPWVERREPKLSGGDDLTFERRCRGGRVIDPVASQQCITVPDFAKTLHTKNREAVG